MVSLDEVLARHGLQAFELPNETATAEQAARAVGGATKQIVKSLLLISDQGPILVLAAGDEQVNVDLISQQTRVSNLRMARAAEVKQITGFSIGAVPPFGHATSLPTFMDQRLHHEAIIYAAAGNRFRVFAVNPSFLQQIASATTITVSVT